MDQFYTDRDVAVLLLSVIREHLDTTPFLMIEPSAGEGAFLDQMPAGSIGYDREPKGPGIINADFLATIIPGAGPKMVVGNPPFGKNSSLAIRFFNHAAWQVDVVAFVVPRTFRKASVQNRLNRHFHLLHELPMPANAFVFRGQPYDVPTVFQIWARRPERRALRPVETSHPDWEFTTPDRADFAIQRIGARAGRLHRDFARSTSSHYFIRCHRPGVRRTMARLALADAAADTAGNPAEAVRILRDVEATHSLGIHWGTFQLTDEARDAPKLALATALSSAGIPPRRFVAAQPGSGHDFDASERG